MICSEVYVNHERLYTFDTSNKEKGYIGLIRSPIYSYLINNTLSTAVLVANLARALSHDNMNGALSLLQVFFLLCHIVAMFVPRGILIDSLYHFWYIGKGSYSK